MGGRSGAEGERLHRGMHRIQADAEGQALGRKTAGRSAQAPRGVRTHGKAAVSSSGRQRVYSKPPFLKEMPALLKRPALPAHTSSSLISAGLKEPLIHPVALGLS